MRATAVFDRLRNRHTSNKTLEEIGTGLGLQRFITPAAGANQINQRTMTATVEAIVGAAYLDRGIEGAKVVISRLCIFWELGVDPEYQGIGI